jgi:hypothetical protein
MSKDQVRTQIRLPARLHAGLQEMASKKGISLNALMIDLLWDALIESDERYETENAIALAVVNLIGNLNQLTFEQLKILSDLTTSIAGERIKQYGYEKSNKFVDDKYMLGTPDVDSL